MKALVHREGGCGLYPRHPIVCGLDLLGVCMALGTLIYRPALSAILLPLAVCAQYGISCVYHWLPYSKTRQVLDHLMIAVLIAATYVHYWARALPYDEASWRIIALGGLTVITVTSGLALPAHKNLRNALYLALGLGGLTM